MSHWPTRREFLLESCGLASAILSADTLSAQTVPNGEGCIVGDPSAERVGSRVLADGGNAIDALVAGALVAAVTAVHQTGIGGYGGAATLAVDGGKRITSIDFNSAAPLAAREDMFQPGPDGTVPDRRNEFGWSAVGVPGVLAGLQLALDRFGTRKLGELLQPAIELARNGFPCPAGVATAIRGSAAQLQQDPGSQKLYCPDGQPLTAGATVRNPKLADMLATLAAANSVESFYRGEIARAICAEFQKQGSLLTEQDLAGYEARVVAPLTLTLNDFTIHTAPLTAGGLTVLQALNILKHLNWAQMPPGVPRTHAKIEALRLAWRDRLSLLGDPQFAPVPVSRLLSDDSARDAADRIRTAVQQGRLLAHTVTPRPHTGTIHLSAADRHGNFAALTFTHGNSFGARVTIEELGLTLGHGLSRFEPKSGHPNSPGPGKRPLHNMVPTIVTRAGRPVLAVGGRGGRKIPNAMFELLAQFTLLGQSLSKSIAAPRFHTEGNTTVDFEKHWPAEELKALERIGYTTRTTSSATLSAIAVEESELRGAVR